MKKLFAFIICSMLVLNCGFASLAANTVKKSTTPVETNQPTEPEARAVTPPITSLVIDGWGK